MGLFFVYRKTKKMTELTLKPVSMTSLTEKRHNHVMDDIRKMLSELELNAPDFSGTQTLFH